MECPSKWCKYILYKSSQVQHTWEWPTTEYICTGAPQHHEHWGVVRNLTKYVPCRKRTTIFTLASSSSARSNLECTRSACYSKRLCQSMGRISTFQTLHSRWTQSLEGSITALQVMCSIGCKRSQPSWLGLTLYILGQVAYPEYHRLWASSPAWTRISYNSRWACIFRRASKK